jgi:hypothetical protein
LEDLFWPKVNKTEGCWLWTGSVQGYKPHQYGKLAGKFAAHRLSYQLAYGDIPKGMSVCHRCDNPLCVRPEHLFLGTHADNMRDMAQKRRSTLALTPEQEKLAARLAADGMSRKRIAARFGVHFLTIARRLAAQRKDSHAS